MLLSFIFINLILAAFATAPLSAVGTTLPSLNVNPPYRVFNDLQKQSYHFVAYTMPSWSWVSSRYWNHNLAFRSDNYPSSLDPNVYAVAQIDFFSGIDNNLIGNIYNVSFSGNGSIGIVQNNGLNITFSPNTVGTYTLTNLNSLFVYIYNTSTTNPVTGIRIIPSNNNSTFTSNFLSYVKPFQVLRYAFWQGQNLVNNQNVTWANRATPFSASQIISDVAL